MKDEQEYKIRKINSSKKYYTGSSWNSIRGGTFVIKGQSEKYRKRFRQGKFEKDYCYFIVEFYNGYLKEATTTNIKRGNVANPYHPTVHGVGYLGEGVHKCGTDRSRTDEYLLWAAMIARCYSTKSLERQPSYKDCTVTKRWHNFQNFCEDIKELEGYEKWKSNCNPFAWALDKDIKIKGNKVYSPDTCMFVTIQDNNMEMIKRIKEIKT